MFLLVVGAVLVSGHADAYSGLPVDGTFRLRAMKDELDRALSLRMATDENYRSQLRASTRQQQLVPGISEVGFQVFNFSMGAYEYRPGRFVARGKHCNLFIERGSEAIYGQNSNAVFAQIVNSFDEKVFPSVGRWFGKPVIPPAFNLPDERIYIFLVDIRDNFSEGYVAGYFDHRDLEGLFGNQKPVFFMDIAPGEPGNPEDKCNSFYRTLAHEFQHMVNFSIQHANGSVEQERWLDEGFSMFSEYVFSGEIGSDPGRVPPAPHFERFLENHGVNLISNARESWFQEESLFRKYGASFLFVAYLVEKFGGASPALQQQFTRELVRTVPKGVAGLEELLEYSKTSFAEVFVNFGLALVIDDPALNNGLWGFNDKFASFGKSASLIPVKFSRSYAATGDNSFIGGSSSVPANCLNIEEVNGKGKISFSMNCEAGMSPWIAELSHDNECRVLPLALDSAGQTHFELDFAGLRRFFLMPVALKEDLNAERLFSYSFNSAIGNLVLYPVPNPAFAEQVIILLKSNSGPLQDSPLLNVSFNNLIEQLTFSPIDEKQTTFVAHYRLPGTGKGQAVCNIGGNQVSFSFSVARLRISQSADLEVGDSTLAVSCARDNETVTMLATPDFAFQSLPAGAFSGPYDIITAEKNIARLSLTSFNGGDENAGLCRVNSSGRPVSWQQTAKIDGVLTAAIDEPGRYYLFSDTVAPVVKSIRVVNRGQRSPELMVEASDDLSGIDNGSLKVSVDDKFLDLGNGFEFSVFVPLEDVKEGPHRFAVELADRSGNRSSLSVMAAVSQPPFLQQTSVYPNPCRNRARVSLQFAGKPDFGESSVSFYDASGHRLVTLPLSGDSSFCLNADWDLRDSGGRRVANGVYFFRVKAIADGTVFRSTGKIAVLK